MEFRTFSRRVSAARVVLAAGVAGAALMAQTGAASALESRSYVVSYFSQQFNSRDGDCPGGVNPDDQAGQNAAILQRLGYKPDEVKSMMAEWAKGGEGEERINAIVNARAVIDGQQVNAYTHPEATLDPGLKLMTSKVGYGFNLDGKDGETSFTDPRSGEKGVDHMLSRAIGCNQNFRGSWDAPSAYGEWIWVQLKDSQPAWLITITGEDIDKDGPVTLRMTRALEYLKSNLDGSPRHFMTYRVDPDPRSHNEFKGEIKDGVLTITEHKPLSILWNALSSPVLNLKNTHMRINMLKGDTLDGLVGGYQPWTEIYFAFSHNGIVGDRPGLYWAMKKAADADPDPVTGQNMSISTAYRITAVPAFVVDAPVPRYQSAEVK